ncbi:IS30 family transposase [Acidithiobacillus ferriphilus]|uniref:IS30 family transposase n=1 Tax=Acidithiobacillus ferriphilus TaxID=1689834 RepID=UPI002DB8C9E2|nr:IS30 family transposase [Acidithiobacillus ferriphilus]MEB8535951.1 IS30 family transposase [Acidithiobacillus ferriphilus]
MGTRYSQLSGDERNQLQRGLNEGRSLRALARSMGRNPGTLSRECRRGWLQRSYDAVQGGGWARSHRRRGPCKLLPGSPLTEQVHALILERTWSPEQIAGRLQVEHPDDSSQRVSHETVYQYIYAHPAGELKKLLVDALRQGHQKRRPRSRGKDRRGGIRNMRSIRERPEEAQSREVPGHWEGDLIKGAFNGSAIGTLVDRSTRFVILAKVDDSSAEAVLEGFTRRLRTLPRALRKTLTYDQGREMARHEELEKRTHLRVYFADPHSPWQRPTNENTNGLLRQYFPKGTDLSKYSQQYLTKVAEEMNNRPRKSLGFRTPTEVMAQKIKELNGGVALQN